MKNSWCFLLICLFIGCNHSQKSRTSANKESEACTTINIPSPEEFDEEKMLDSVQLIKLEVTDSSLLGYVSKLRVYQDRIYVQDRRYAKALLIFDRKGKFLKRIKNEGRGPKEFLSITNFEIAYPQKQLVIMDNFNYKFGFFDLEGNYLKETRSKIGILNALLLPEGYILHAKSEYDYWKTGKPEGSNRLYFTTEDGKLVKSAFPYNDNADISFWINHVLLAHPDGTVTYAPRFRDTIYNVSYDRISPRYALSYGSNPKIPMSVLQNASGKEIEDLVKHQGKDCFLGEHLESEDYLYFRINFLEQAYAVIFDKTTGKCRALKVHNEKFSVSPFLIPLTVEKDYFWTLLEHSEAEKCKSLLEKQGPVLLDEDDNPYLVRYKFKGI